VPEEEFAPAAPAQQAPEVEEEFAPAGNDDQQGSRTSPPPVSEEFGK
jgi:hypothetical protein